ncbi:UPF0705 protein C11orf49 [Trichonephila clavata]|uniref:Centriolar satellite-associated tubulin polyglutamylase complex regulator 1 n=1 Tax=Trichonephila clavata TaxID=2740835 RepID=A0A8X6I2H1_TRICU|nr:UPF0705 protein C11orf49 [Trichonephila clavata]
MKKSEATTDPLDKPKASTKPLDKSKAAIKPFDNLKATAKPLDISKSTTEPLDKSKTALKLTDESKSPTKSVDELAPVFESLLISDDVFESSETSEYLEEHCLQIYLEDAVTQMLILRSQHEEYKTTPENFLMEYFNSVHKGTHVLIREFSFISATLYNRLCVIRAIILIFKSFLPKADLLNAKHYHSLLQILWPTFPLEIVQSAFDANETKRKDGLNFVEFVSAMKNSFCVGKFCYEDKLISTLIDEKIENFSKVAKCCKTKKPDISEFEFLRFLEDSGSDRAYMDTILENGHLSLEFKRILDLIEELNLFPKDESDEVTGEKSSCSPSGSEQNESTPEESDNDQDSACSSTSNTDLNPE